MHDPSGVDQFLVKRWQVPTIHTHIDVVGQVVADIKRHHPKGADRALPNLMGGLPAIG